MNIYALIPLTAVVAYIPLLVTTISSRPWQTRHRLFLLFLIAAMTWSLTDVFLRSNAFPQYNVLLLKLVIIGFTWTAVQFHVFASSFFPPGQGRWLPLAYFSLAMVIALVAWGYLAEGVTVFNGDKLHLDYGRGTLLLAPPLVALGVRLTFVFGRMLRTLDNPVLRNQIFSLLLGLLILILFTIFALLPWGREFAITHFGNMFVAFTLSYAVIRHQLVDIRMVLRRGLAWVSLGIIGIVSYVLLLAAIHSILGFDFDISVTSLVTVIVLFVAMLIYKLRDYLFVTLGKAFQGRSYDYRQKLSDFASKIHNVFSLKEQGGQLLELVTKAIGCRRAGLLFPEGGSQDFVVHFVEPKGNGFSHLRLSAQNPIVDYLRREQKLLTKDSLEILPEFRALWTEEKKTVTSNEIELFVPLISRERLIGILVLEKKHSGRYSLEDLRLLEEVTERVAVSMEKEYLRERLREREEELSVINRSSAIISSSLDIPRIYDSFIQELKKVLEVNWAAIALIEETHLRLLAVYSEKIESAWKVGERVPLRGTATEWVANHKETVVEPDLSQAARFVTGKVHLKQGVRSIVYLPLMAKGEVIGSFTVASSSPNAYTQRHIALLEQLASQIAMSIENSRLYAKAEEKARIDELTGLLNRRSLDEQMANEINRHSRYGGVFSLIILDLDGFKAFNDNYGHLAGDKLLGKIGNIMRSAIRSTDQAFRYGGDEFAILLPNTPIEAATQVAERIRKQLPAKVKTGYIPITASFGLATWPANGMGANEVIGAADAALYQAKRKGGNRSHCASGSMLPLEEPDAGAKESRESETLSTIYALAETVDARDHYSQSHWKRVREYAVLLGRALNLEALDISKLETCALLHDIGKIGISSEILNKQGKLTAEEWEKVKSHPQVGVNIAGQARQLAPCLPGILYHHERYDGSGYPKGLKGEEIPLEARILAIADAFAAMTSTRSYSEALSVEEALKELKQSAGKQFDPHLVEVFCAAVEAAPVTPGERR
jgi:diguanylate cyclase (GGDEF)-like protein